MMTTQSIESFKKLQSRWFTITTVLLVVTVLWNMAEGGSSIYFGLGSNDISLFAFGIDSLIEVLSASLVLYNMTCTSLPMNSLNRGSNPSAVFSLEMERKLTMFIGTLLVLFCIFACVGGAFRLIHHVPPSSEMFGIIIGGICVVAMFVMWYFKTKASLILNSSSLASEAACSLSCIGLSAILCIGSIVYTVWPSLWWVDAATVIVIGLYVGKEGFQSVRHAMDKKNFTGGCGCCSGGGAGAANSSLGKFFNISINYPEAKQLGETLEHDDYAMGENENEQGCDDCDDCEKGMLQKKGCGSKQEKQEQKKQKKKGCCDGCCPDTEPLASYGATDEVNERHGVNGVNAVNLVNAVSGVGAINGGDGVGVDEMDRMQQHEEPRRSGCKKGCCHD